jgi:DNA-binding response OmpR family regulator
MPDIRAISAKSASPCDGHSYSHETSVPYQPTTPTQRLRILLVEDDPAEAQNLAHFLTLNGHEVLVAQDGPVAVRAARHCQPDVVLLDIGLPGLDGYQVASQLCRLHAWKRPLLVAITGYGSEDDRRRSEAAGIDLHLVKPVEPHSLENLLRRFCTFIIPPVG